MKLHHIAIYVKDLEGAEGFSENTLRLFQTSYITILKPG